MDLAEYATIGSFLLSFLAFAQPQTERTDGRTDGRGGSARTGEKEDLKTSAPSPVRVKSIKIRAPSRFCPCVERSVLFQSAASKS